MNRKFRSSVAGASIIITITGLISKGLGFFREIIFASFFGLSSDFDIYLVSAVLPLTINTIILYLAQNYLIPAYSRNKGNNARTDSEFIQSNLFLFFSAGLLLSIILFLFSETIITLYLQGHNTYLLAKAVNIFRLYLISIPINCAVSVLIAYQQTDFEFRFPAYSQLLLNISFLLLIIGFSKSLNIFAIPLGYNVGIFFQMIYLLRKSGLKLKLSNVYSIRRNYGGYISGTLLLIILIESIGQLYVVSDRYFYNYLPTGGIAALNYAQTVFLLPLSILSIAISTAIFPRFADCISRNSLAELESVFNESIKINIIIFVPVTILFFFYGDLILKLFFQRGKFSPDDTLVTYSALTFFSISMVFYAIYNVMNKLIYSLGLIKKLLFLTILGVCLKVVLNFLLVDTLKQNGLALSTSISYVFFFFFSFFFINRHINLKRKTVFINEIMFSVANGLFSLFLTRELVVLFLNKKSFIEIVLFLLIFFVNILLVNHSLIKLLSRLFNTMKGKMNIGRAGQI